MDGGWGFYQETYKKKIHPYLIPVLDEMHLYLGVYETNDYIKQGIIDVAPLEYMRGRNFHRCFMILDEAQNADLGQIKMFLTRIGRESKCVLNGDPTQTDLGDSSGFLFAYERLYDCPDVGIVELYKQDIVRNAIIGHILDRLN